MEDKINHARKDAPKEYLVETRRLKRTLKRINKTHGMSKALEHKMK